MKELLKKIIAIPSVSRDEGRLADFLSEHISSYGFSVNRVANNLWVESERPSSKPTILLNAHIDTVKPASTYSFDPFTPFENDGAIYGLGSNDDGGSLVALLESFLILSKRELPYRLVLSLTAEEEVSGLNGLELLFPHIGKIDFGIMGEPSCMNVAVAEKGLMVLDCTASGKSGHAARNEGVNAIYKAIDDIEWFKTYHFPLVSDFVGPVKMSVTQINAGTQHNVVPDTCSFVVDVRNNGMYSNIELLELIKKNVHCQVKERSTRLIGSFISLEHPFVRKCISLGCKAFGSPTLSNQALCNFPTVKLGPGDSARSHTADEYILEKEIEEGATLYVKLLEDFVL